MKLRKIAFILVGLAIAVFAAQPMLNRLGYWSFTESVRQYEGRFYRVIVKTSYKGEPQEFNFVVGCNVRSIRYKDGSSTREVGLIPAIYGRRMTDDKVVVIRPPDLCDGQTTKSGHVPKGFIPLITVYDNSRRLDEGLAYISEDAYFSPIADLTRPTTEIIASNRQEFDEDGKSGAPNFVTRELYWSKQGTKVIEDLGLKVLRPPRADQCYFALRYRLPKRVRDNAAKFWPKEKPEYWLASSYEDEQKIFEGLYSWDQNQDNPEYFVETDPGTQPMHLERLRQYRGPDQGVPTRKGPWWINSSPLNELSLHPVWTGDALGALLPHYPVNSDLTARHWPEDPSRHLDATLQMKDVDVWKIETDSNYRGFARCWLMLGFSLLDAEGHESNVNKAFKLVPKHMSLNGIGVTNFARYPLGYGFKTKIFERDEYLLDIKSIDNGIMGGDVR